MLDNQVLITHAKIKTMPVDLPVTLQEKVKCSIVASVRYQIPTNVLLGIAEIENGKPGQKVANSNGTYDIGSLQFNTAYLAELKKYGIRQSDAAAPGCYPYHLAAWRLKQHITNDKGDFWSRAANYHSKTPSYNMVYRAKLMTAADQWANWLMQHYETKEIMTHIK